MQIDGFHSRNGRLKLAEMSDHVTTRIVEADKLNLPHCRERGVGDFGGFHPGASVEGLGVGENFDLSFAGSFFVTIAVKIIGDVPELDSLGNGELRDFVLPEKDIEWIGNLDWWNEDILGDMLVRVVFSETGKVDTWEPVGSFGAGLSSGGSR